MGMERYQTLCERADEMGEQAIKALPTMRGSERGPMCAALAQMWASLAALEVAVMNDDRRARKEAQHDRRIATLEARLGIAERQMPDPFDEPATVAV